MAVKTCHFIPCFQILHYLQNHFSIIFYTLSKTFTEKETIFAKSWKFSDCYVLFYGAVKLLRTRFRSCYNLKCILQIFLHFHLLLQSPLLESHSIWYIYLLVQYLSISSVQIVNNSIFKIQRQILKTSK